ncbi:N-acetyl-gamma-glutamyl-phosphate reductase [Helicobacter mustelae]|uniref:N-acetyl-gamma-glutamyl-phosphate reductase n=1 Tax=Helicobacter mustelae (strain ATCC 43772 / CCUG 25715 / CIP 103759 / LMG 18044 / NCTC 12198 / R85-136P) TaxID=679897 RepID=D3UGM0_HELM1|nr:N-acetyl-gamma-glutamyl-phosphate reductase [Helicobacter mustelae]CBG39641.1 N-acetyl-gamma-glutamyl-phosphate reductase [Helicobacter mustelae 12198]SQH71152.1 N-acetyl-gamma-glutamyl-phosphate reductase [Helicobacter mustelae]STP12280.1 N-acetyl-gamma-glutamyl-phosphate reductase [Helicobacter mustelae]
MKKIPVGIIGVGGYTGLELFKILSKHPYFTIAYVANTSAQDRIDALHPSLTKISSMPLSPADPKKAAGLCELLFLALPHQESMQFAKEALELGTKVIDLSADYRLSKEHYEANYCTHKDPKNLEHAVYGLVEYQREAIKNASLIANPGCYPTASLLGLLPFLPYMDSSVFIDAKSGVSGAGKKLSPNTHYPLINENIFSYQPLKHRHQIEIAEKCQTFGHKDVKINFIPHLTPLTQGMLVSIFATLHTEINPLSILQEHYANEPCIRIREHSTDVLSVRGTNFCDIYAQTSGRDLYVCTSIDNLMRGASSQAVVNANLMFGLDELSGIPLLG